VFEPKPNDGLSGVFHYSLPSVAVLCHLESIVKVDDLVAIGVFAKLHSDGVAESEVRVIDAQSRKLKDLADETADPPEDLPLAPAPQQPGIVRTFPAT
jgi:hypothetical protein